MTVVEQAVMSRETHEAMLTKLSNAAVEDFKGDLQFAEQNGFDYVEVAKVEKAIIALAIINGAHHVPSLASALEYLQELDAAGTHEELRRIESDKDTTNLKLSRSEIRVGELEEVLTGFRYAQEGVLLGADEASEAEDVLRSAHDLLHRIPGQRELASRAIDAARLLSKDDIGFYVPTRKADLDRAFPDVRGSARGI